VGAGRSSGRVCQWGLHRRRRAGRGGGAPPSPSTLLGCFAINHGLRNAARAKSGALVSIPGSTPPRHLFVSPWASGTVVDRKVAQIWTLRATHDAITHSNHKRTRMQCKFAHMNPPWLSPAVPGLAGPLPCPCKSVWRSLGSCACSAPRMAPMALGLVITEIGHKSDRATQSDTVLRIVIP
jgi:hypothetical protein